MIRLLKILENGIEDIDALFDGVETGIEHACEKSKQIKDSWDGMDEGDKTYFIACIAAALLDSGEFLAYMK